MAVQVRNDVTIRQFILRGDPKVKDSETFLKDATATAEIAALTVVTQDPATLKWVPLTNVAATNGTGAPKGVVVDAIPEADIKANDVTNQVVIVGGNGMNVDKNLLVFENSVALDDEITALNITVEDALRQIGIFAQDTDYVSQLENS